MEASSYRLDPRACPACLRPRAPLPINGVLRLRSQDRASVSARSAFRRATKILENYERRLRSLAKHVGDILRGYDVASPEGVRRAEEALRRYERTLDPWAEAVAERMIRETAARDERSWFQVAARMGRALKREIANAPTGTVMRRLQAEQVTLIRSIPREAAERVHAMAREAQIAGIRPEALAQRIMEGEGVSQSKARLIARTETGRVATTLTQSRAEHVGSEGYFWRDSEDVDVRPSHKAMRGKFVRWDSPPTLDGLIGHAGALPNYRCYPEPVLDGL